MRAASNEKLPADAELVSPPFCRQDDAPILMTMTVTITMTPNVAAEGTNRRYVGACGILSKRSIDPETRRRSFGCVPGGIVDGSRIPRGDSRNFFVYFLFICSFNGLLICLFICLLVCLFIILFVYLFTYSVVYLFLYLFVRFLRLSVNNLFIHSFVRLCLCLFVYTFVGLFIYLFNRLLVYSFKHLFAYLFVYLFTCLFLVFRLFFICLFV